MVLVLGLFAASGQSSPAAPPGPSVVADGVLDRLAERYADVPALQASFVQTSRSPLYGEETQKGTVALERPDKVRWEFDGDRVFITDGTTLWIWSPRDQQVLRFTDAAEELTAALQVLQSLHRVRELFAVTVVSSDATTGTVLSLAPKPGDPVYFEKLVLTLDPALSLKQVDMTDPQGTHTNLVFSGVVLGKDLPDELFTFVVPAGVEVVDAMPAPGGAP